ncbi:hypothetical protein ACO2Q3_24630 [Caulobacter sp. KR2-114]|uniref:hypothetical protein n=1 Tax=Caulobacter sp. KR2-114 TaxID=3400912 RepID=UPI003BFF2E46
MSRQTRRTRREAPPADARNLSAKDLWSQVLKRLSEHPNATLQDPDYDPEPDRQKLRIAMRDAGWTDDQIDSLLQAQEERIAAAPSTSPGVAPHAEFIFGKLCDDVEAAMTRLGMDSHGRVARGIEPRLGPWAAKTNVIMTDESIVTVGAQLFRFCGVVARAFTRTVMLDPTAWESANYRPEDGVRRIRSRPDLLKYWLQIYLSYAVTGMHVLVPFRPSSPFEAILFEQVARAMELFATAHEFGHHHLDHGRAIDVTAARREEYEADQFALRICREIEKQPVLLENPYLSSGAGGLILLRAMRMLGRFEAKLDGVAERVTAHWETIDLGPTRGRSGPLA